MSRQQVVASSKMLAYPSKLGVLAELKSQEADHIQVQAVAKVDSQLTKRVHLQPVQTTSMAAHQGQRRPIARMISFRLHLNSKPSDPGPPSRSQKSTPHLDPYIVALAGQMQQFTSWEPVS